MAILSGGLSSLESGHNKLLSITGKATGIAFKGYNSLVSKVTGVTTGPANKLWRGAILLHRATHGPSDGAPLSTLDLPGIGKISTSTKGYRGTSHSSKDDPAKPGYTRKDKLGVFTNGNVITKEAASKVGIRMLNPIYGSTADISKYLKKQKIVRDKNQYSRLNEVIIFNTTSIPYQYITLQNRPTSLEFRGETSWATIKSMGRNNPMYHYTGAEDTLQFNISWYCNDPNNPAEVVNKCRLLESWSKANGYKAGPPVLKIMWGGGELFENHLYILTSATYTLGNFNNVCRIGDSMVSKKLYPATATQELIFKRVSSTNLMYEDIISSGDLSNTRGIGNSTKLSK
jgi:hypothetical protein